MESFTGRMLSGAAIGLLGGLFAILPLRVALISTALFTALFLALLAWRFSGRR